MKILAIETSCDETAASVLQIKGGSFKIQSNIVSSQIKIHAKYGGIVPEVAARKHVELIIPVINDALKKSGIKNPRKEIDVIAVTEGPGLVTSLLVGMEAAKTFSYLWNKPLIGVNHIAGHIYSPLLENKKVKFPILSLVVSGGHTELVLMKDFEKFKVVGQTIDDAAGEAFDKVAKILELQYPGGPVISKLAEKGDAKVFDFPRPMKGSKDFNFSFSGLKTAALYKVKSQRSKVKGQKLYDICASFEEAVADVLVYKTIKAADKYKVKTILLGGGVSANTRLRKKLKSEVKNKLPNVNCQMSKVKYTGDNAAMIGLAGYLKYKYGKNKNKFKNNWRTLRANPELEL